MGCARFFRLFATSRMSCTVVVCTHASSTGDFFGNVPLLTGHDAELVAALAYSHRGPSSTALTWLRLVNLEFSVSAPIGDSYRRDCCGVVWNMRF
jgi:hypothetical protein